MLKIVQEGGCRVFLKPGQGKTAAVLKAFDVLRAKGFVDKLLVIAPLRVITTSWPHQIEYWKDFDHLTYKTIHGGDNRRRVMDSDSDIYLMNVEGLVQKEWCPIDLNEGKKKKPRYAPNPIAQDWMGRHRVMLVVDESTKFKNSNSLRFQSLKCYLHQTFRRVILTGTPRPGRLSDLFSQCYITDLGKDLGEFITHFRRQYMYPSENGFGFEEQPGAAERVAKKIAPTTVQVETEEAVPTQEHMIWLPMPPEIRTQYNELREKLLVEIDGKEVMAPNAGVLYGKLRQLAQGAVFHAATEWTPVHGAKLDAMENLLEELNGEPLFGLYAYSHDLARLSERLGAPVPYIGAGVSARQGAAHCAAFSAGTLPLLMGHPQSVALGVDGLQNNCSNVVWFGLDPSWENYYQANLRIVRPGTKASQVNIYHILLDCGVERSILETVRGKQKSEAEFLSILQNNLLEE